MASDTAADTSGEPQRAAQPPADAAQFNAWLDSALGRTLTLVTLRRAGVAGDDGDTLVGWRAEAGAFPRVRLIEEAQAEGEPLQQTLARVAQRDPDALLVCDAADDTEEAQRWRAALLDAAEGLNLFERTLITLAGVKMTRPVARKRGFEDGFALERPLGEALAILAREAVTREAYRRYGSSPPCYL